MSVLTGVRFPPFFLFLSQRLYLLVVTYYTISPPLYALYRFKMAMTAYALERSVA